MPYSFTDYAGVRAALGVSAKELPDTILSLDLYANQLYLDLRAEGDDILTDYATATGGTGTAAVDFVAALDVHAIYAMASYCASGLPQFSPKSITDGKAGFSRYAESPFVRTIEKIADARVSSLRRLQELYAVYLGTTLADVSPQTLMVASPLTTDPVTGA